MSFVEFQNGHHGGHLGYQKGTILAVLNLHVATMPPTKFNIIQLTVLEEMSKMRKANNGRMDYRQTDRQMTVNRPWHKLTWSKAPGELITVNWSY